MAGRRRRGYLTHEGSCTPQPSSYPRSARAVSASAHTSAATATPISSGSPPRSRGRVALWCMIRGSQSMSTTRAGGLSTWRVSRSAAPPCTPPRRWPPRRAPPHRPQQTRRRRSAERGRATSRRRAPSCRRAGGRCRPAGRSSPLPSRRAAEEAARGMSAATRAWLRAARAAASTGRPGTVAPSSRCTPSTTSTPPSLRLRGCGGRRCRA
mmetsp:Transcript_27392/g.87964  ORF Transcript_27392/g.87964 Transcript_27392/m.87964 type:complete len:210 (+) Transcript_27392:187-816(+)